MGDFDIDESIDIDSSDSFETTSLDSTVDVMDSVDIPEDSFDTVDLDDTSLDDYSEINEESYVSEIDEIMNDAEIENLEFDSDIDETPEDSLGVMDDVNVEELDFDDTNSIEEMDDVQEDLEQSPEDQFEEMPAEEVESIPEELDISDEESVQEDLEQSSEDQFEEMPVEEVESTLEELDVSDEESVPEDLEQSPEDQFEEMPAEEVESIPEELDISDEESVQEDLEQSSEDQFEEMPVEEVESTLEELDVSDEESVPEDLEQSSEEVIELSEDTQDEFEEIPENLEQLEEMNLNLESWIENASSIEELTNIRNQILQEGLPEQGSIESDIETQIDNATSVDELTQIRNQILQEGLPEQNTSDYEEFNINENTDDSPKTLTREFTPEILDSRTADIEEVLENYSDNLREYGVDENAIEQFISQERDKMNTEYESLDRGDLESAHYDVPTDWENIAAGLKANAMDQTNIEENIDSAVTEIETIDPSEIDYDEVFEGLDSYDFDGVDYLQDTERLDNSLTVFQPEQWQEMDLNQQKEAMTELAEYVQEVTGLENPPTIEFYNNPVDGDYGGYMASTNTLSVNEHMLYDSNEAADTVAHELWHAYQHERAMNPQSAKDYQYQYNFDHYISPKRDIFGRFVNFTEYQDQLVEAEARAFAEQFKGRISEYGKSN